MSANILQALIVFLGFFALSLVIDKILFKLKQRYDSSASESFRLMSNSQRGVLLFIGTALALSKLGFDIGALVAGLGLTGFALGFALKDAISNLVSGIMIVLYKPIKLGYVLEVKGARGTVVDLNLRYITLQDGGLTHLLPNSVILSEKLTIVTATEEPAGH
ncbi:MAG: mechanosensitive ion channel [Pseudohongiellaceae bacterium]|nr:mechanosensitive ion channel [Pseudohongiellaceae bacterium]